MGGGHSLTNDDNWFEEFGFEEVFGEDLDVPNPLTVTDGVLPADAREHLLAYDEGRVIINYPPDDQQGLEVLAPVFDVVRSILTGYGVVDFSLLSQIPHLEGITMYDKIRTAPERQDWPELRRYDGPWQPEAASFLSAPRLASINLRGATQQALDLIQGPLSYLGLQRPKLADGSPGWPYPAEAVYIDTVKKIDVSCIRQLPFAEMVVFDGIGEVSGLDVVSSEHPFGELSLRNVRSLGETDPWKIKAQRISVAGKPNVMKWVNEALLRRPDDWDQKWVFDYGWVPAGP